MGLLFRDRVSTYPNRYKLNKADGTSELVTLERADSPTQVGTPLNADTFNAMQRGHTPHNLLDNSDFRNPVNQRGLEGYSGNNVYTIDRWVITSDNGKACGFVVDNGYLINLNGATLATLTQRIVGLDQNKRYTFAYEDADGNIHIQNPADIIWGDNYAYARIIAMANTTVKWAALYEGEYTAETLPEYQPKGYGAELAECQRYANVLEVSTYGRVGLCDVEEGASNGLLMVNTNQMRQGVVPSVSLISGNWTDLKLRNSSISVTSMTGFGYQVGTTHPFLVSLDGVNPSTRIEPILNTSANVVKILISLDL